MFLIFLHKLSFDIMGVRYPFQTFSSFLISLPNFSFKGSNTTQTWIEQRKIIRGATEGKKKTQKTNLYPICLKFSGFAHRYQSYIVYLLYSQQQYLQNLTLGKILKNLYFYGGKCLTFERIFFEHIRYTLVKRYKLCSLGNREQTCKISSKSVQDSKSYGENSESSSAKILF